MANIKSAVKRIRIAQRNRKHNLFYKNKIKKLIRDFRASIVAKKENAAELLNSAVKWLDKAASKNIIKKQTASRKKSRLMKLLDKSGKK